MIASGLGDLGDLGECNSSEWSLYSNGTMFILLLALSLTGLFPLITILVILIVSDDLTECFLRPIDFSWADFFELPFLPGWRPVRAIYPDELPRLARADATWFVPWRTVWTAGGLITILRTLPLASFDYCLLVDWWPLLSRSRSRSAPFFVLPTPPLLTSSKHSFLFIALFFCRVPPPFVYLAVSLLLVLVLC